MKDEFLQAGLERARAELGRPASSVLAEDETAVALKYALVVALTVREGGAETIRARERSRAGAWEHLAQAAGVFANELAPTLGLGAVQARRAAELAADTLLSERLCPETVLPAAPQAPPDAPVHLIVFTALPHIGNEIYPLLVDALVVGLAGGDKHRGQALRTLSPVFVLAAHASWLEDGKVRRAFWLDEARHLLVEAELTTPVKPASGQVLALDLRGEAEEHRRIAVALGAIPLVNPPGGAARLDDKVWTGQVWEAAGLATPRQWTGDIETAHAVAEAALTACLQAECPGLVLKPRRGTEGRGVRFLAVDDPATPDAIHAALAVGETVSEERGTLRFAGPQGAVRFVVRLNVCWDGARAWAESGYGQVAGAPEGVASVGRGGRIVALSELWTHLCDREGAPVTLNAEDWRAVMALAEAGVGALAAALGAEAPLLVGVDLLLDGGAEQALMPVLLEANPRPAGTGHARYVTADGPGDEPGVSAHLWEAIARRRSGGA